MTENNVWPEVDLTDSEDEEDATKKKTMRKNPLADCAPELTKEEIEGDFPIFLQNKDGSDSSDEDESDNEKKVYTLFCSLYFLNILCVSQYKVN